MNVIDFFRTHGVEFREHGSHHHVTHGWINTDCPLCSPKSGHFRLGWNLEGQYFSCWHCGKVSTTYAMQALTRLTYTDIKPILETIRPEHTQIVQTRGKLELPEGLGPLGMAHIEYLRNRGFRNIRKLERLWDLKGIGALNAQLPWRVFIPVIADGETISWTTRAISSCDPIRYRSAASTQEVCSIKSVVYGEDFCEHTIIIVEGPIDAWKIGPGAVALFGLEYTRSQLLQLSRYPIRYVCLDSAPAAQRIAERLCNDLLPFPGKTLNIKLDADDPGSASESELKKLRKLIA